MTRPWSGVGIAVLAMLHPVGVVVPAVVLAVAADRSAVPDADGATLIAASAVIGSVHGVVTWYRLRREWRRADRLRDVVIASFDGLVVLALMATLLVFVALGAYAPLGIVLANRGWPVLVPWVVAQGLAMVLAEATRSGVLAWLE